ncbi:hypothetical protein B0H14DRAFT_2601238 [Mycena olivaceomarginata]|nr:hypothetical protein B0H14DRAFT_2601238 [Mycena olivaceomarginata]
MARQGRDLRLWPAPARASCLVKLQPPGRGIFVRCDAGSDAPAPDLSLSRCTGLLNFNYLGSVIVCAAARHRARQLLRLVPKFVRLLEPCMLCQPDTTHLFTVGGVQV